MNKKQNNKNQVDHKYSQKYNLLFCFSELYWKTCEKLFIPFIIFFIPFLLHVWKICKIGRLVAINIGYNIEFFFFGRAKGVYKGFFFFFFFFFGFFFGRSKGKVVVERTFFFFKNVFKCLRTSSDSFDSFESLEKNVLIQTKIFFI